MKMIIAIIVILLSILGSYLVAKIMVKTKKGFGKNLILEKDSKETLEEIPNFTKSKTLNVFNHLKRCQTS